MKSFLLNWTPVILLSLAILFLSVEPIPSPAGLEGADVVAHFLMYLVYAFFISRAGRLKIAVIKKIENKKFFIALAAVVAGTGYGVLMELIQSYVPYRNCSFYDGVANFFGAMTGVALYVLYVKLRMKFRRRRYDN